MTATRTPPADSFAADPFDPEALNRYGLARFAFGDLAAALSAFQRAADLDPDLGPAWNNAGMVARQLGQPSEAIRFFNCAAAARSDDPQPLLNRAAAQEDLGDAAAALADYDRAAELAVGEYRALAHIRRGMTLVLLNRAAEAEADFARARELSPALWPLVRIVLDLAAARATPPSTN